MTLKAFHFLFSLSLAVFPSAFHPPAYSHGLHLHEARVLPWRTIENERRLKERLEHMCELLGLGLGLELVLGLGLGLGLFEAQPNSEGTKDERDEPISKDEGERYFGYLSPLFILRLCGIDSIATSH